MTANISVSLLPSSGVWQQYITVESIFDALFIFDHILFFNFIFSVYNNTYIGFHPGVFIFYTCEKPDNKSTSSGS